MTPRSRTHRPIVTLAVALLLSAGCGGSDATATRADEPASSPSSPPAATAASGPGGGGASPGAPAGGAAPGAAVPGSGSGTGTGTGSSGGTAPASQPAGTQKTGAPTTRATAAGRYTYDTSGTVTVGTPQDATGTSTLTVDRPAGGQQHTALEDKQGRTEQDLVVRAAGTYLVHLSITNPAFSKEFRPVAPVLLVPEPADPGRTWSWTTKSTDGKTTLAVTARIVRRETLTIGGVATPTSVVTSTLRLTGDVTYTGQTDTWYDPAHRLTVKDHTRGEGTVSGVAFSTDITSVLRSTRPA